MLEILIKKITFVTKKFKKYLIKNNSLLEIKRKNIFFTVINLKKRLNI